MSKVVMIQYQLDDFIKCVKPADYFPEMMKAFVRIRDLFKKNMNDKNGEYLYKLEIVDDNENTRRTEWIEFDMIDDILNPYIEYYSLIKDDDNNSIVYIDRVNFCYQKKNG